MDNKRIVLQIRLEKELKDDFQQLCKQKAINSSELLRQLITQWISEQHDMTITHKRHGDI